MTEVYSFIRVSRHIEAIVGVEERAHNPAHRSKSHDVVQRRNRDHFKIAVYFHCGGLDLYPASVTHRKAG